MKAMAAVVILLGVTGAHAQPICRDPDRDPCRDPSIMSPKVTPPKSTRTPSIIRDMKQGLGDDTCIPCKERWGEQDKRGSRPW